jgi:hypothetical protein
VKGNTDRDTNEGEGETHSFQAHLSHFDCISLMQTFQLGSRLCSFVFSNCFLPALSYCLFYFVSLYVVLYFGVFYSLSLTKDKGERHIFRVWIWEIDFLSVSDARNIVYVDIVVRVTLANNAGRKERGCRDCDLFRNFNFNLFIPSLLSMTNIRLSLSSL